MDDVVQMPFIMSYSPEDHSTIEMTQLYIECTKNNIAPLDLAKILSSCNPLCFFFFMSRHM